MFFGPSGNAHDPQNQLVLVSETPNYVKNKDTIFRKYSLGKLQISKIKARKVRVPEHL